MREISSRASKIFLLAHHANLSSQNVWHISRTLGHCLKVTMTVAHCNIGSIIWVMKIWYVSRLVYVFKYFQHSRKKYGQAVCGKMFLYNHCNHCTCPRPLWVVKSWHLAWKNKIGAKLPLTKFKRENLEGTAIWKCSYRSTDGLTARQILSCYVKGC